MKNLHIALSTIRNMVKDFVEQHDAIWDEVRSADKERKGYSPGDSLSMQSYIGSDLLLDFVSLASASTYDEPFVREYWVRSMGIQCINSVEDVKLNKKVWNDVVAKFIVVFDGHNFTTIDWFQDEDCRIKNNLIYDDSLAKSLSYSNKI